MNTKKFQRTSPSKVVSIARWQKARESILNKEKAHMKAGDALAAQRRRLPHVLVDKEYVFDGSGGPRSLLELFDGRPQLIVYHFMFAPDVHGWPSAGCVGCSMMVDNFCNTAHLHARNTSLALVSLAELGKITRYRKRMGWDFPWFSSAKNDFNKDFGLTTKDGEIFGLSVFIRQGRKVFRTYFTDGRGVESIGTVWGFLDVTPLGRQETWEDSPEGTKQTPPFSWWRRHDEYP